ncbi:zinc finger protein 2-like [Prorops nasuta]|uniref:zinc finger protein 2-like n=1 Tax=Prorops nasuta TaxID=863751 RepID=UPI0034CFA967
MRVKTIPRQRKLHNYTSVVAASTDKFTTQMDISSQENNAKLQNRHTWKECETPISHSLDSAIPSTSKCVNPGLSYYTPHFNGNHNNNITKVVDLSTDSNKNSDRVLPCNSSSSDSDRFKDTFLYQIMTDPTFLDTIQKNKQAKKHTCPFCKQEFPDDEKLDDHMDIKKDKSDQVVCCACNKAFAQKRYLRYHQRCHSDRNKFTCLICTKKYTRLDNLTRHNAFHVNPDKFPCNFCEKTFARKDLLNKHQKCHENKMRFYCETCVKFFKGPLTLDNHNKSVHSPPSNYNQ